MLKSVARFLCEQRSFCNLQSLICCFIPNEYCVSFLSSRKQYIRDDGCQNLRLRDVK